MDCILTSPQLTLEVLAFFLPQGFVVCNTISSWLAVYESKGSLCWEYKGALWVLSSTKIVAPFSKIWIWKCTAACRSPHSRGEGRSHPSPQHHHFPLDSSPLLDPRSLDPSSRSGVCSGGGAGDWMSHGKNWGGCSLSSPMENLQKRYLYYLFC